ncbi:uncharacterized protein JCM10292_006243 [Rhodotorula paludigena]|uniref:uncharacterized protein n=1 Tax=Rhodotorula paludigena TaxID=86838 RepID=UPI00316BC951
MRAGLVAHDLARARDHHPVPHSPHPGSSSRYARPDLERSNTSTSFASFWLGKALGRKPSQQQHLQQRVETGREVQQHALRESRLVQVERLPRDDRIRAWALRREDEVGGLERWRREVAVEVERERRDEEEVLRRAREASASTTVRDLVAEAKGLLESSPFSTSFRVKSLALPPSPTASTDIASPPETLKSTVTPPTNLSHAVIATAELRSVGRQAGLTPSRRQMPQPTGDPAQEELAASFVATASSVADPHPTPPPSYRFPVPPTPPFSRLAPLEAPPLSASPSSPGEPQPWTGTPPPRSSSLPFLDLLDAPFTPGAEAAGPPPECSLIPPKAAALLGLVPPAAASSLGTAALRPPFYAADLAAASVTGALGRASIETSASSSLPTLPTSGGRPSLAHARAPHNTSTSSFAYSTTQPTSATGRKDSNASAAAAAAAAATATKLSLDLTRGAPRLVVVPPTRPSSNAERQRTLSSFAYSPAASHAKVPRKKPSFARLRLHRGGMASLPDLHGPALQADWAAATRRSVRPVVQGEWRNFEYQRDHQASWYDGSSDESGADDEDEEEIESILDAFYPPPAPPKRERSLGSLRRRIGGSLRRKSSFRCCGDRIEAQQSHAAPSARTGEGAVKSLVRSLSRSRSKRAVRFAPAEDEPTVRQREVRQARRRTREEWEFESAALAGRMDRHV